MRAGAVLRSSNEAFSALQSGAKAKADFERKFFGVDSDTWLEDFKREYAELSDKRYHYSAQHKELCAKILVGLKEREIDLATTRGFEKVSREKHPNEKLPVPPANEPILIRRSTVPPEGLFLEEAVDKVPWVNRCLSIKASNQASIPIRVMRRQDGDEPDEKDEESPAARRLLRLLERSNAHMSGTDLIESISVWMNTRQALVWMMWDPKRQHTTPKEAAKAGLPNALYCLPAHRCVGMMWEGSLLYYRVTGADGLAIPSWQIIRIGFYNPKEEFRCLSPLSAAFQCADTDYAMDLYNANIFENGLKLSGVLSFKNALSDEKRANYENLVQQYVGVGNSHAVLVLDGDASFETMAAGTKDMDYKGLADLNKQKLTGVMGVPRAMLGDMEGSRSLASATVSRKSFWQDTNVPELGRIIDKLNVALVPYAGDADVYFEPDYSKVEALSDDRSDFAQAFLQVSQAIVQLNQIQAVNPEDIASILEEKFGVKVQGEAPLDTYGEDEEIMAESASVQLVKMVKNMVLDRMRLDPSLEVEIVPVDRVARAARKLGMKPTLARTLAEAIAKNISALGRDREKVAQYFDGLKVIAGPKNENQNKVERLA